MNMRLNLFNSTQTAIQAIFKQVSYTGPATKAITPNNDYIPTGIADSLLAAYWNNNKVKYTNLAKMCEHMSKKAVIDADIAINTGGGCE